MFWHEPTLCHKIWFRHWRTLGFCLPEFTLFRLSVSPLSPIIPVLVCQKETSMFCELVGCCAAEWPSRIDVWIAVRKGSDTPLKCAFVRMRKMFNSEGMNRLFRCRNLKKRQTVHSFRLKNKTFVGQYW